MTIPCFLLGHVDLCATSLGDVHLYWYYVWKNLASTRIPLPVWVSDLHGIDLEICYECDIGLNDRIDGGRADRDAALR